MTPETAPTQTQLIAFTTQGVINRPLVDGSFTNTVSGGAGTGAITYQSSNLTVATVNSQGVVTFVAPGTAVISASKAADATWRAASANYTLNVTAAPGAPVLEAIALSPGDPFPGGVAALSADASDPQGSALTYAWEFGDGGTGSNASESHVFATEGEYAVKVSVTNAYGVTSTTTRTVTVAWRALQPLVLEIPNPVHLQGDVLFAGIDFQEPNGLEYEVSWDLGDGTTSTEALARHQYGSAGDYVVRATVTNSRGESVSAQQNVSVLPLVAAPAPVDNTLQVYCAGPFCGAQDTSTYRGEGVGIWRYHNATTAPAIIDVAIEGLHEGQSGSLVFSNGTAVNVSTLPAVGAPSSGKAAVSKVRIGADDPHVRMLERNQELLARLSGEKQVRERKAEATRRSSVARAATVVGATRTWKDAYDFAVPHQIRAVATCDFSTGRRGVVWTDDDPAHALNEAHVQLVADYFCGAQGVYERMVALHGDVYGPAATGANLIKDTPELQDVNVVIIRSPNSPFAGYFSVTDYILASEAPSSNQAVGVVLNGAHLDGGFGMRQTLVHEFKHLINGYQRGLVREVGHASWLEESSAMLAEDLINAEFNPSNPMEERMRQLLPFGGLTSLVEWGAVGGADKYALGGSFGGFLHRRYGAGLDDYLLDTCVDHGFAHESYQCVDDYIKSRGGAGFADEYARFGVSLYAFVGGPSPRGFGWRGAVVGPARVRPVAKPPVAPFAPPGQLSAGSLFKATSHAYSFSFMGAGETRFVRKGVVVPEGTTMMVVVNEALP